MKFKINTLQKIKFNSMPIVHIELEKWKYNKGLDIYVSSFGRLKDHNGKILTVGVCNNYLKFQGQCVHRLVMSMFNPVPGWEKLTVDHLDHNTRNNRISNLEWVTAEENSMRAAKDEKEHCGIVYQPEDIKKAMMVKLNGATVPFETAKQIMLNDKTMQQCKDRVKNTFESIANNNFSNVAEVRIGGYKLEKA